MPLLLDDCLRLIASLGAADVLVETLTKLAMEEEAMMMMMMVH